VGGKSADVIAPAIPIGEAQRLRAVAAAAQLYTPAEARFDRITRLACSTFDMPIALVTVVADCYQWFKSAQGITVAETSREASFCAHAILEPGPLVVNDALADPRFRDNALVVGAPGIRFYAGHPIHYRFQPIGSLCVLDTRPREIDQEQRNQLRSLAAWVENEINPQALSEAQRNLLGQLDAPRRRELLDPLTGTWNRAAQQRLLSDELELARQRGRPVTLLQIDVDHLERVNQTYGSPAGDAVLAQIAQRIRGAVRPADALIRSGSDEFLLLLGDVTPDLGVEIANRVLLQVGMTPLPAGGHDFELGVSIGVASTLMPAAVALATMLDAAGAATREAKAAGRSCVRWRMLPAAPESGTPASARTRAG